MPKPKTVETVNKKGHKVPFLQDVKPNSKETALVPYKKKENKQSHKKLHKKKKKVGASCNEAADTGDIIIVGDATDVMTGVETDGGPDTHACALGTGSIQVDKDAERVKTGAQAANGTSALATKTGKIKVGGSAKGVSSGVETT